MICSLSTKLDETALGEIQSLAYSAENSDTQEELFKCIRKIFGLAHAAYSSVWRNEERLLHA